MGITITGVPSSSSVFIDPTGTGFSSSNLEGIIAEIDATLTGDVAQNTASRHPPLVLGTGNGLILDALTQTLTLNLATPSSGGAISGSDKSKLDNINIATINSALQSGDNISELTNDLLFQTEGQLNTAINGLVDSAPTSLGTLGKVAAVIQGDVADNTASRHNSLTLGFLSNGLTLNNTSQVLELQLANTVNAGALSPSDKSKLDSVDVNLIDTAIQPSDNVSELTNDSDYQSLSQVTALIDDLKGNPPNDLDTLEEIANRVQQAGVGASAFGNYSVNPAVINEQFNVASITKLTVGQFQVNFTNSLLSSNYTVVATVRLPNATSLFTDYNIWVSSQTSTSFVVSIGEGDNGGTQDVLVDIDFSFVVLTTSVFSIPPNVTSTDDLVQGLNNLYFSDSLVSANPDVTANSAARHDSLTLGASSNGLLLDVPNQSLQMQLATTAISGALSNTDKTKIDQLFTPSNIRRVTNLGTDLNTNLNTSTTVRVLMPFNGATVATGGFTPIGASGIRADFDGTILIGYNVVTFSAGTRVSLRSEMIRDRGGVLTIGLGESIGYIRNTNGHDSDDYQGCTVLSVLNGDIISVSFLRDSPVTTASTPDLNPAFWAVRIA